MEGSKRGGAVLLVDHLRGEVVLVVEQLKGGAAPMQVQGGLMLEEVVEVEDRRTIPHLTWVSKCQHQVTAARQTKEGHHAPLCRAD